MPAGGIGPAADRVKASRSAPTMIPATTATGTKSAGRSERPHHRQSIPVRSRRGIARTAIPADRSSQAQARSAAG